MNKIEEILKSKGITSTTKCHNYEYLYKVIQESMKEFGRLAFEAARKYHLHNTYEFGHYEDFLKKIEDET